MSTEEWREIDGFPGYEVSNLGRVRSFKRKRVRILKDARNGNRKKENYRMVSLTLASRKKSRLVHRLVAKAFIDNPSNLPQVNHIDGNQANNCVENLEWASARDNIQHALQTGLIKSVLDKRSVLIIKTLLSVGVKQQRIASVFGVHRTNISQIKCGRTWSHVDASV